MMASAVTATSIEELKATYRTEMHPLLGECVVIPVKECPPSLEADMRRTGHKVTHQSFRGVTSIFISVAGSGDLSGGGGVRTVFEPNRTPPAPVQKPTCEDTKTVVQRAKGGNMWKNVWTIEEDALLIELWIRKLKMPQIIKEFQAKFPKRTSFAVANRISALQSESRIEPRWKIKSKQKAEPSMRSAGDRDKRKEEPIIDQLEKKTATTIEYVLELLHAQLKTAITERDLLKELLENVYSHSPKLDCYIIMHALELKEVDAPDFTIPQKIIDCYLKAQLYDDADSRREFHEKVKMLLEVYA